MSKIDGDEDFHPLTRGEWRAWLAENYARAEGVWMVYYKKAAGKEGFAYDETVEEALSVSAGSIPFSAGSMSIARNCFSRRADRKASGRGATNSGSKN
jgi:uncharacterized protein YdeI (YjbR/CyaY-like superfamily)